MRRRHFITLIGGAAAAWPLAARAEVSTKRPVIAVLSAITKEGNSPLNAFVQGLKELGYVDGVNVDIVYRYAEEHLDRFPLLAAQVVELKPDVILATVTPAVVATRALTKSIPIVCPLLADAINLGLIATEARPGGNAGDVDQVSELDHVGDHLKRQLHLLAGQALGAKGYASHVPTGPRLASN